MDAIRKSPEYTGKSGTTMKPQRTGQTPPKRLPPSPAPAKKQRTR